VAQHCTFGVKKWSGTHKHCKILYSVRVTWSLLTTSYTCYATEDAVRIVNSFITIPVTRNYIHSQLFITLCHIYTAYNDTRSGLQSLITLTRLHWLTSQLSITVSNYHRLYIFTLRNSRRDLTPRIHFLQLTRRSAPYKLLPRTELNRLTASLI
jgi:hypothetical protein